MACFTVPATEAIITTIAEKIIKSKEKKQALSGAVSTKADENNEITKISFSTKLGWLNKMLWGGSALLAFEHVWHGEVVPWFPFLTAAGDPEEAAVMLQEMSTVGVTMAALVTLVWAGMLGVSAIHEKKAAKEDPAEATEA